MSALPKPLVPLLLLALGAAAMGEPPKLPQTEAEKQALSDREVTILRRQMMEREDTAALAYKNAETAFLVGEYDKAIEEFLAVSREYGDTSYRMKAVLRVGDVYYRQKKYEQAVSYYQRALKVPSELWWPEESAQDYARADYMIGVCYFDQKALNQAFAQFRHFAQAYPDSELVDRAYDFIGRGSMEMERYGQAIDAFRMVGTSRLQRGAQRTISPGEELYVRVVDPDVGLAARHAVVAIRLTTTAGDEEVLELKSLGLGSPIFLGTITTRLGEPRLTRTLDEAFSPELRRRLDQQLREAGELDKEARQVRGEVDALPEPDPGAEDAAEAQGRYASRKQELTQRARELEASAEKLRAKTFATLDEAYAGVETILKDWGIEGLGESAQDAVGEGNKTQEAGAANGQGAQQSATGQEATTDRLSYVFSREEVLETRRRAAEEPTAMNTYPLRRAVLEYWHKRLLQEYKTLDLNGSDTVQVHYQDQHGAQQDQTERTDTLGVASDATILCVGPNLINRVNAVILGDEVRVRVIDPDMDRSPGADAVQVMVASMPRLAVAPELEQGPPEEAKEEDQEEAGPGGELFSVEEEEEEMPVLLPEGAPNLTLNLTETGPHTGEFIGAFPTLAGTPGSPAAPLDLSPEKTVRLSYADKRTSSRGGEWVVVAQVELVPGSAGENDVIEKREGQLDRRSELEKGIALGKLARVYQGLGLTPQARSTFDEALKVVKAVVAAERDSALGEQATYQMWDLYFASGNEAAAAEACAKLIATFPNSPLADDALLIMGKAEKDPRRAIGHYGQLVNRYPDSPLAPEAQYRLAELKLADGQFDVASFEACVNKYPESNFAAQSLLQLSEYYIEHNDFDRARDYLERIELDYPDFERLDRATYLRGACAYRTGDIQLAYTLMHEVLEKYPGTALARSAAKIVGALEKKLKDQR